LEVLALEARVPAARVAGREIVEIRYHSGQEAAPQRRIGDERDAEVPRRGPRLLADLAIEQRVFALHRRDRVGRMGLADAFGRRLAESEMLDLALLDQPRHAADRLLDRDVGVDAVLEVHVDHIDAEPLQARLAGLLDVFGAPVDTVRATGVLGLAELARDHDLVPHPLEGAAEQFLVLAPAVHVGAVEEIDAEIDRLAQEIDPRRVVALAVDARQRHAAKPERRHRRPVSPQFPLLHSRLSYWLARTIVETALAREAERVMIAPERRKRRERWRDNRTYMSASRPRSGWSTRERSAASFARKPAARNGSS